MVHAALEAAVQRHTFPKANVDIYCLVLESGGADAAVAITAASLAIADAGIEMYDLVSACSVVCAVTDNVQFLIFMQAARRQMRGIAACTSVYSLSAARLA